MGAPAISAVDDDIPPPTLLPVGTRGHTLALALLAYSVSTVKVVDVETAAVHAANMYEEDDFVVATFGLDFLQSISPKDVVLLLRDAEAALLASASRLRPVLPPPLPTATAHASKKKRGKTKVAAIGVTVGVESLPVTCMSLPADTCILSVSPGPSVFEPICDDAAEAVALVDALVARLRMKRCYYIGHLYMVRSLPACNVCAWCLFV